MSNEAVYGAVYGDHAKCKLPISEQGAPWSISGLVKLMNTSPMDPSSYVKLRLQHCYAMINSNVDLLLNKKGSWWWNFNRQGRCKSIPLSGVKPVNPARIRIHLDTDMGGMNKHGIV